VLYGSEYPGGKSFNRGSLFIPTPPTGQAGAIFGRNVLRGLPELTQVDFAIQRQFQLTEKLRLNFRSEFLQYLQTNPQLRFSPTIT